MSRHGSTTTEMVAVQHHTYWYRCDWCGTESTPKDRGPGRGSEPEGWAYMAGREDEWPVLDCCPACRERVLALRQVKP